MFVTSALRASERHETEVETLPRGGVRCGGSAALMMTAKTTTNSKETDDENPIR